MGMPLRRASMLIWIVRESELVRISMEVMRGATALMISPSMAPSDSLKEFRLGEMCRLMWMLRGSSRLRRSLKRVDWKGLLPDWDADLSEMRMDVHNIGRVSIISFH